jgi:hypothetical protein
VYLEALKDADLLSGHKFYKYPRIHARTLFLNRKECVKAKEKKSTCSFCTAVQYGIPLSQGEMDIKEGPSWSSG